MSEYRPDVMQVAQRWIHTTSVENKRNGLFTIALDFGVLLNLTLNKPELIESEFAILTQFQ